MEWVHQFNFCIRSESTHVILTHAVDSSYNIIFFRSSLLLFTTELVIRAVWLCSKRNLLSGAVSYIPSGSNLLSAKGITRNLAIFFSSRKCACACARSSNITININESYIFWWLFHCLWWYSLHVNVENENEWCIQKRLWGKNLSKKSIINMLQSTQYFQALNRNIYLIALPNMLLIEISASLRSCLLIRHFIEVMLKFNLIARKVLTSIHE